MNNSQKNTSIVAVTVLAIIVIIIFAVVQMKNSEVRTPVTQTSTTVTTATTNQVASNIAAASDTNVWKTLNVSAATPSTTLSMKYPTTWTVSQFAFSCGDATANTRSLTVMSPSRTNLPGYVGTSVAYMVQLCVSNTNAMTVRYKGFIKSPLAKQPADKDLAPISENTLLLQPENALGQKVIASYVSSK